MFTFALKKNSWCRDSQYPLSFLSPLRPLWPLWPLQTGTHTNKERPVTVSRSHRTANIQPDFRPIASTQADDNDNTFTKALINMMLLNVN